MRSAGSSRSRRDHGPVPAEAFAYALAALELRDGTEARGLALEALWASPMPLVIGHEDPCSRSAVDFSPDGRWLGREARRPHRAVVGVGRPAGRLAAPPDGRPRLLRTRREGAGLGLGAEPELFVWSVPELERLGTRAGVGRLRSTAKANIANRLRPLVADPSAPGGWRYDHRALTSSCALASEPPAGSRDESRRVGGGLRER